jgi:deoxycytidylate deaminase
MSNKFNKLILDDLKKTAMKSSVSNRHSAALIKKDIIYKSAYNKFIKEIIITKEITHHITIHAEVNAICSYYNKKNVKGMDLIVIRVNKYGTELKNSRPCNNCITKLRKLGIRKVYYSNEKGDIIYEYANTMKFLHISSGKNNLEKSLLIKS